MSLSRQIVAKPSKLEQQRALLGGIAPLKTPDKKAAGAAVAADKVAGTDFHDLDVELALIKLDQSAQPREHLSTERTAEYAEAMKAGDQFPPLVVFFDGGAYWLADGFHRHYAAQQAGRTLIRCQVRQGGLREAILYSVGANAKHGLPRSDNDKERAVLRLLDDPEWSKMTDREMARRCHVSHPYVAKVRAKHAAVTGNVTSERTYTTKHGTTATMKTAGINSGRKPFQAKASEDNGSITGVAGAVAGEASRLASGRTDAGEAVSADLPTHSEPSIFDQLMSIWQRASEEDRARFLAAVAPEIPAGKASGAGRHSGPRNPANRENGHVDRSAPRATQEQIDQKNSLDGMTSPAGREGEQAPAPIQRKPFVLRPYCQNREVCAGVGIEHCYTCRKAMPATEVSA
jgi:hypothetical protein